MSFASTSIGFPNSSTVEQRARGLVGFSQFWQPIKIRLGRLWTIVWRSGWKRWSDVVCSSLPTVCGLDSCIVRKANRQVQERAITGIYSGLGGCGSKTSDATMCWTLEKRTRPRRCNMRYGQANRRRWDARGAYAEAALLAGVPGLPDPRLSANLDPNLWRRLNQSTKERRTR